MSAIREVLIEEVFILIEDLLPVEVKVNKATGYPIWI